MADGSGPASEEKAPEGRSPGSEGRDSIYHAGDEPAALVKRRDRMVAAQDRPAHPAPSAPGWLAGRGTARTVWLASEQPQTAEGIWAGCLLGAWDSDLEPGTAIGWHRHDGSEEMYLLLRGALTVRVGPSLDEAREFTLAPGDTHRVPPGWCHASLAGPDGARIVVVEWSASG